MTRARVVRFWLAVWLAVGVVVMVGRAGQPPRRAMEPTTEPDPSAPNRPDPAEAHRLEARLRELRPKFRFDRDEIRGGGWFEHRWLAAEAGRAMLAAPVNATGFTYLRAQYVGDQWVFADRLVARIGDRVIETGGFRGFSSDVHRNARGSGVSETLHFTEVSDGGLLAAIASDPKRPVRIRFEGRERQVDITLPQADRVALAESYELGAAIRRLGVGRALTILRPPPARAK